MIPAQALKEKDKEGEKHEGPTEYIVHPAQSDVTAGSQNPAGGIEGGVGASVKEG